MKLWIFTGAALLFEWTAPAAPAIGPLRVHPTNPRYFTDGTKTPDGSLKAVYLTGSHTWGNLTDGHDHPEFDYTAYLDFLDRYKHNFIRLWSGYNLGRAPIPYERTGPGAALDGQPKVDLARLDPRFFERLRSRVTAARDRGIYVAIMLFAPDGAKKEDWPILFFNPGNNMQARPPTAAASTPPMAHVSSKRPSTERRCCTSEPKRINRKMNATRKLWLFTAAALFFEWAAPAAPAIGPLRVHPTNPRYFTDGTKAPNGGLKAVYLTGSHTWPNLMDRGAKDPPPVFDFDKYLKLLEQHGHNFIRLWRHEHSIPEDTLFPLPYRRTGPKNALDGKPKYDLNEFNPDFFDRLRKRVIAARDRGIYVGIMFFKSDLGEKDWKGHPYNTANNVNGINGDPDGDSAGWETHTLKVRDVTRLQEAYVRKVVDTVNDLDNVLYEIANEAHVSSAEWQYHMIEAVKKYEAGKPKQHPVGMTSRGDEPDNEVLLRSPSDWVSPGTYALYAEHPAAADGRKVSLLDTDHIFGVGGDYGWIWKAFTRGHNPIYMDIIGAPPYGLPAQSFKAHAEQGEGARRAMGHTRRFAVRMSLAAMAPRGELSSTKYCLANRGAEYLIYQPESGEAFSVELKAGKYRYEWFDPTKGATAGDGSIKSPGGAQPFKPPFAGDAVLYLKAGP